MCEPIILQGHLDMVCQKTDDRDIDFEKDGLEIYVDGDAIILKKYQPACIFCGSTSDLTTYMDKNVCTACAKKIGG